MTKSATAAIAALRALGITQAQAKAIVTGIEPAPARGSRKANTFHSKVIAARVACAYGAAPCESKHFAPNGVGARMHTTCPKGRAALVAARK